VILGDRDVERLWRFAECGEVKIAVLRGRAHRRVVPLLEACRHQRLNIRGQKPRGGAGGIGPKLAQNVFLGLVGIGLVLCGLVLAARDDLVHLAQVRRATLDCQQASCYKDRFPSFGEGVERLVVLVEEQIGQDANFGEALCEGRCLGDPGKRVVAM